MLSQFIYRSRSTEPLSIDQFNSLAVKCDAANQSRQISGVLLYDGVYFLQIIEGPASVLEDLIARIKADSRHDKMVALIHEPVFEPRFAPFGARWIDLRNPVQLIDEVLGPLNRVADERVNIILKAFINGQWRDHPTASRKQASSSGISAQLENNIARQIHPALVQDTPVLLGGDETVDLAQHKACFAFQPVVDMETQTVSSYEALIRGQQGQSPLQLLGAMQGEELYRFDLASKSWALQTASRLGVKCGLALNLFPQSLVVAPDAVAQLIEQIAMHGFEPRQISLEVTEEGMIADTGLFMRAINQLRSAGVKVAIDDFGAGYAGLSLLADFQPDKLKIDRRIVTGIHENGPRQAIVWAVVEFCNRLGITVVAEGVETEEELQWLLGAGVHRIQGFLLAKPLTWGLPAINRPKRA